MNKTDIVEILLVEDNPNDVELALHALKKNNLANHIHTVRDGQEALDFIFGRNQYKGRLLANGPRVILLDLKLPKVDGLQVLKIVKADPLSMNIPIVIMTSSREEQDLLASYHLRVNSYIIKPVDFSQFTDAVRQLGFYWLLLNKLPAP